MRPHRAERVAAGLCLAQAVFFAISLIWPAVAAPDMQALLAAALARTALWQALLMPLLALMALPVLAWLAWRAEGPAGRVPVVLALVATAALLAVMGGEFERVAHHAAMQGTASQGLRQFALSRGATFLLAAVAVLALRLARRAGTA
jgi:hypothetical protein